MDRLFRDWRYALLWVIGISAIATAYFAEGGGHEQLQAQQQPAAVAPPPAAVRPAPSAAPAPQDGDESTQFGEPIMDTTGFDPNPAEPGPAASPQNPGAAAAPEEASAPAPAAL